jgi:hypothetical protein
MRRAAGGEQTPEHGGEQRHAPVLAYQACRARSRPTPAPRAAVVHSQQAAPAHRRAPERADDRVDRHQRELHQLRARARSPLSSARAEVGEPWR